MLWGTYVEKKYRGTNLEGYDHGLGIWDNGFEMGSRNDCLNTKKRRPKWFTEYVPMAMGYIVINLIN